MLVKKLRSALGLSVPFLLVAFAQQDSGGSFQPGTIATGVMTYIGGIAAAGVAVLALTVGLSAAWRYAKKFLKG
jgi:type IV secretory pathway VirB2 component (pilin)